MEYHIAKFEIKIVRLSVSYGLLLPTSSQKDFTKFNLMIQNVIFSRSFPTESGSLKLL